MNSGNIGYRDQKGLIQEIDRALNTDHATDVIISSIGKIMLNSKEHVLEVLESDEEGKAERIEKFLETIQRGASREIRRSIRKILLHEGKEVIRILTTGHKDSPAKFYTLEKLGIQGEILAAQFKETMAGKQYIEASYLFEDIRSFFNVCFPLVDLSVYKFHEKHVGEDDIELKSLRLVVGDDKICPKRIILNRGGTRWNLLERKAFRHSGFINDIDIKQNEGGDAAFRLDFKGFGKKKERYVLSFKFKDSAPTDGKNRLVKMQELGRIEEFLKQGSFVHDVNDKLGLLGEYYDEVTGLNNGKYLEAVRNQSYAIMAIDVNEFKRYNDLFGHQEGNKFLEELGKIFQNSIRFADRAIRNGGDEFILLIRIDRNINDQEFILDLIKQRIIENLGIANKHKSADRQMKITIGYSKYDPNKDFSERMKEADDNMYHEKPNDGRMHRVNSQFREFLKGGNAADSVKLIEMLIDTIITSDEKLYLETLMENLKSIG